MGTRGTIFFPGVPNGGTRGARRLGPLLVPRPAGVPWAGECALIGWELAFPSQRRGASPLAAPLWRRRGGAVAYAAPSSGTPPAGTLPSNRRWSAELRCGLVNRLDSKFIGSHDY